jgi:hypothetical protein
MQTTNPKSLSGAFAAVAPDAEMQTIETALRPLTANGFEFRGGDMFGQEVFSIYINDRTDEFVIMRFNRPANEPPLIHRGRMAELDSPMDSMNSLPFVTIPEFLLGQKPDAVPAQQPVAAAAPQARAKTPGL